MKQSVFHEGEQAVQKRAGVAQMAAKVGNGIHDTMPLAAQEFVQDQPYVVIGATDMGGAVWASLLSGEPGFLETPNDTTLVIHALPSAGDPLHTILARSQDMVAVGALIIDTATRRRMRVNGTAQVNDGGITIHTSEVYANCPKYIQRREPIEPREGVPSAKSENTTISERLTAAQQGWVTRADTFFIASSHAERGADASHRGGNPGFVQVSPNGDSLLWPDYSGNNMFNTLGNLALNPHAGLIFVDFERGDVLQLSGEAHVIWDGPEVAALSGAERAIRFTVRHVVERKGVLPIRYELLDYSRFNPS